MGKIKSLLKFAAIGLFAAAIAKELKKPSEEREWHGTVADVVPYDFRAPTLDRIKEAYWNPDDPRIITDRVFGVGWAVNFGRLYQLARGCCQGTSGNLSE